MIEDRQTRFEVAREVAESFQKAAAAADPRAPGVRIDPWRGAVGYGHAYGALAASLEKDEDADTFVVLDTSHAPMREPFALCNKAYDTPLGPIEAKTSALPPSVQAIPLVGAGRSAILLTVVWVHRSILVRKS